MFLLLTGALLYSINFMEMENSGLMCLLEEVKISFLKDRSLFILKLHNFMVIIEIIELVLYLCSQKAHVQQFLATEDALNKAAEARDLCEKLLKRLQVGTDVSSRPIGIGSTSQNVGSLRQLEVFFIQNLRCIRFFLRYIFFFESIATLVHDNVICMLSSDK